MIPHSASHVIATDFDHIRGIVERNFIGSGPVSAELVHFLQTRFECRAAVLTDSGTAALRLSLLALRERHPSRRRVVTSAYVCPDVVCAIAQAGFEPIFADIRTDSLNIDMRSAANLIGDDTAAVICTNVAGVPDDYRAAASFGVPVISDCAQAIGTEIAGRDLALDGQFAILSFGATKMITAGGAGALLCRDEGSTAAVARLASRELSPEDYRRGGLQIGWPQHVGDVIAGVALAQLRRLEQLVARRREIAASFDMALQHRADVQLPAEDPNVQWNRYRYYFLAEGARAWVEHLRICGIDARRSIAHVIPDYLGTLGGYSNLGRLVDNVVTVPIYPAMTEHDRDAIVRALRQGPRGNE